MSGYILFQSLNKKFREELETPTLVEMNRTERRDSRSHTLIIRTLIKWT